eukprot:378058-Rhodomonas_salina.1
MAAHARLVSHRPYHHTLSHFRTLHTTICYCAPAHPTPPYSLAHLAGPDSEAVFARCRSAHGVRWVWYIPVVAAHPWARSCQVPDKNVTLQVCQPQIRLLGRAAYTPCSEEDEEIRVLVHEVIEVTCAEGVAVHRVPPRDHRSTAAYARRIVLRALQDAATRNAHALRVESTQTTTTAVHTPSYSGVRTPYDCSAHAVLGASAHAPPCRRPSPSSLPPCHLGGPTLLTRPRCRKTLPGGT